MMHTFLLYGEGGSRLTSEEAERLSAIFYHLACKDLMRGELAARPAQPAFWVSVSGDFSA